jgi:membrane-associated protease RseP (regulator of RpoE activity)
MSRHLVLFLLTALTTTAAGALNYAGFVSGFSGAPITLSWVQLGLNGLWFSVPFLGFLTAHEFGHYFAARWHGLRPSLPYFIPFPPLVLPTGSLGAVIVFRGHFPDRRVLFDFAAGGPVAGFVVAVIALALGLSWSPVEPLPANFEGAWLAEPLMFQWLSQALAPAAPPGTSLNLHPTAFAGWLGLLFTMMNLVPIGQLDGGHITYAVVRRGSRWVTLTAFAALAVFIFVFDAKSWILWAGILLVLMYFFGWEHPPALDDDLPLDPLRLVAVALVIAIFVVSFMAVPISDFLGTGTP